MPDLKLLALDTEDLEVISATTQDAVVRVGDMGFAKADNRFALLMNRFAWEEGGKTRQRKRAALHFDRVNDVKVAGIDTNAVEGVLELLAIRFTPASRLRRGVSVQDVRRFVAQVADDMASLYGELAEVYAENHRIKAALHAWQAEQAESDYESHHRLR